MNTVTLPPPKANKRSLVLSIFQSRFGPTKQPGSFSVIVIRYQCINLALGCVFDSGMLLKLKGRSLKRHYFVDSPRLSSKVGGR
jgi:hypothetical protein